jgi:hypothetical protein
MDFVVGRSQRVTSATDRGSSQATPIEARILHVRPPRRRRDGRDSDQPDMRAPGSAQADPPGAQVLVLLVPEAHKLPDNIGDGSYRVFLRFAKR